jgi:hypothetical protein
VAAAQIVSDSFNLADQCFGDECSDTSRELSVFAAHTCSILWIALANPLAVRLLFY